MTDRSVIHATIVLERTYRASPARVFAAWSSRDELEAWGNPGEDWDLTLEKFDFAVGGGELTKFGPKGGPVYVNKTRYEDIVPNERIVSSGQMMEGDKPLFASLLTIELQPASEGCRMILTEQNVFFDTQEPPHDHEAGWNGMLDQLGRYLDGSRAAA